MNKLVRGLKFLHSFHAGMVGGKNELFLELTKTACANILASFNQILFGKTLDKIQLQFTTKLIYMNMNAASHIGFMDMLHVTLCSAITNEY